MCDFHNTVPNIHSHICTGSEDSYLLRESEGCILRVRNKLSDLGSRYRHRAHLHSMCLKNYSHRCTSCLGDRYLVHCTLIHLQRKHHHSSRIRIAHHYILRSIHKNLLICMLLVSGSILLKNCSNVQNSEFPDIVVQNSCRHIRTYWILRRLRESYTHGSSVCPLQNRQSFRIRFHRIHRHIHRLHHSRTFRVHYKRWDVSPEFQSTLVMPDHTHIAHRENQCHKHKKRRLDKYHASCTP
mmetsp:Transcript_10406/g.38602  ORF Transcript_10406/g.38602 Transcript_10406/m.38602 type:complete len:240 (+) Transcript_10406:9767-10486(+)